MRLRLGAASQERAPRALLGAERERPRAHRRTRCAVSIIDRTWWFERRRRVVGIVIRATTAGSAAGSRATCGNTVAGAAERHGIDEWLGANRAAYVVELGVRVLGVQALALRRGALQSGPSLLFL